VTAFSARQSPSEISSLSGQQTPNGKTAPRHMPCINCGSEKSSVWRQDEEGNAICDGCGTLFFFLSLSQQPLSRRPYIPVSRVVALNNRRRGGGPVHDTRLSIIKHECMR
jgi:hypothetical protein